MWVKTIRVSDGAEGKLDNGERTRKPMRSSWRRWKILSEDGVRQETVWIAAAGHTITPLFCDRSSLTSGEEFIKKGELRVLSLRNVALASLNGKWKPVARHQMDMMFTHFEWAVQPVLRCSGCASSAWRKKARRKSWWVLNAFARYERRRIPTHSFDRLWRMRPKSIKNHLKGLLPWTICRALLARVGISDRKRRSIV